MLHHSYATISNHSNILLELVMNVRVCAYISYKSIFAKYISIVKQNGASFSDDSSLMRSWDMTLNKRLTGMATSDHSCNTTSHTFQFLTLHFCYTLRFFFYFSESCSNIRKLYKWKYMPKIYIFFKTHIF